MKKDENNKYPLLDHIVVKDSYTLEEAIRSVNSDESIRVLDFFTGETNPNKLFSTNDLFDDNSKIEMIEMYPRFISISGTNKVVKYYSIRIASTQAELEKLEIKINAILQKDKDNSNLGYSDQAEKHNKYIQNIAGVKK